MPAQPATQPIDASYQIETPEGLHLELPVAGLLIRAWAWFLDFCIRVGLYVVAFVIFLILGGGDALKGLLLIFTFVVEWFYPVLFECLRNGQTPGKKVLKLRVIHDDGTPIEWSRSVIRNFLRLADTPMNLLPVGLICMLFHPQFKRLGDMAAATLVVHDDVDYQLPKLPTGASRAPKIKLNVDEQRALIALTERGSQLSSGRRQELAELVAPIIAHPSQQAAVEQLHDIARWAAGTGPDR